ASGKTAKRPAKRVSTLPPAGQRLAPEDALDDLSGVAGRP
ncbi:MAG: hypothetical protein JWP10_1717, partial [Nocardioidaceae bacterium]|nr:hypothetical protein [Nocardioidaceae bacterium]